MNIMEPPKVNNNIPVEDVARFILCLALENGDRITNLKLQKLLYYAQAWFLVNNNNQLLFEEDIIAWQYGPVVLSIYEKYKNFGRQPIEIECNIESDFKDMSISIKHYLTEFCEVFFRFSATELVGMTHQEEPWIEAISKGTGTPISTETMYKFYTDMLKNEKE